MQLLAKHEQIRKKLKCSELQEAIGSEETSLTDFYFYLYLYCKCTSLLLASE